jgi:pimeloyl-ACP methyl ester carboxylesterase
LLTDALAIFDQLQETRPQRVIPIGFSIGSGVAAYVARYRPVDGVILVTPFDSLEDLAQEHFPWAPVSLLLRHRMPTIDFIREITAPTALIAAGRDTLVPPRRSEPLRRAAPKLVFDRTIAEAGHNDLYSHPAFTIAMREAVARIEAAQNR